MTCVTLVVMLLRSLEGVRAEGMEQKGRSSRGPVAPFQPTEREAARDKVKLSGAESAGRSFLECNICLEEASHPVVTLCGHVFCWKCLREWLDTKCSAFVDAEFSPRLLHTRGNPDSSSAAAYPTAAPPEGNGRDFEGPLTRRRRRRPNRTAREDGGAEESAPRHASAVGSRERGAKVDGENGEPDTQRGDSPPPRRPAGEGRGLSGTADAGQRENELPRRSEREASVGKRGGGRPNEAASRISGRKSERRATWQASETEEATGERREGDNCEWKHLAVCPVCKSGISTHHVIPIYGRGVAPEDSGWPRPAGYRLPPLPATETSNSSTSYTFEANPGYVPLIFGLNWQHSSLFDFPVASPRLSWQFLVLALLFFLLITLI